MCYYFNARTVHILLLLYQPTNSQIYKFSISLYNVHPCIFQYLYVIMRESYIRV